MKEVEIGGACSTHRGDKKCIQFLVERPEGEEQWKDMCTDGG
jgi:hypothetical protein